MNISQITNENAEDLNIGDPVIITGRVQFKGKTGDIVDFGRDKRFVIVNLYNFGKHSFHSSDVSYNDYADSGDEQERMSQFEESKTGTKFVGKWKGTDSAAKAKQRLVGEAKSLQSKFEKHLAKHGYDVAEKSKYWGQKLKDIDAQIAAWDAEMERRNQAKSGVAEDNELNVGVEAYGVRGANSKKWRKTFKSQQAFERWLDANEGDVEVLGTREVNLSDMFKEGVVEGLPGSLSKSDYMPGAVRHDLSNIKPKKTGPEWDPDRPVADIDPDWEKEQAAKRKKQGVAEGEPQAKYTVINHRGSVAVEGPTGRLTKGFASTSDAAEWAKKKNAELKKQRGVVEGIFDIFKSLPKSGTTVKVAGTPVEISRAGVNSDYIGYSWTDKNGKEHYEETRAGEHSNLRSLAKTIAAEVEYSNEEGVAEGSNNVRYKSHPTKKTHVVVTQVPTGVRGVKVGDEIARSDIKGWGGFSAERKKKGVAEGDYPKTWHDVNKNLGKKVDKMSQQEKVAKQLAHPDTLKKNKEQGVAEDLTNPNAKPDKVDRKKEPNTRSERYYKNKEAKKKQGVAEAAVGKKSPATLSRQMNQAFKLGKYHTQLGHTGGNPYANWPEDVRRAYEQGRKAGPSEREQAQLKRAQLNRGYFKTEGEYDDPRWEPREPDMSRKVDWDIEAERNEPEEKQTPSTVTIRDQEGNVVLQFPSTGGYYGDVRMAKSKGFDTESGDYDIKWKKDANEDSMMSEDSGATSEQVAAEIVRRIIFRHKDAISAYGPEAIMAAAREVGEYFAGAEELGTSDISIATKYALDKLEQQATGNLQETASGGCTGAGSIAATPTGGAGKNVGSLFGGTYKQKRTKKSPGTK